MFFFFFLKRHRDGFGFYHTISNLRIEYFVFGDWEGNFIVFVTGGHYWHGMAY